MADAPETDIISQPAVATSPVNNGPHHFQVGLDIFRQSSHGNVNYFIHGQNTFMKWKTDTQFVGPRVEYEYSKPGFFYFNLQGTLADGSTTQQVTIQNLEWPQGKTVTRRRVISVFGNLESRIGHTYQWDSFSLIPYGGLGWNYQQYDTAVDESVNWYYVVSGFRMNQRFAEQFDLGLNANITYAFPPHFHNRKLDHASIGFWGYEVGLPFTWYTGKNNIFSIKLEPYYEVLSIKEHWYNLGSRLEFGFRF